MLFKYKLLHYTLLRKFNTYISDYTFETLNASSEDRIVRATLPLLCKATLLMPDELKRSTIQKKYSIKRVHFGTEFETDNTNTNDPPPDGY